MHKITENCKRVQLKRPPFHNFQNSSDKRLMIWNSHGLVERSFFFGGRTCRFFGDCLRFGVFGGFRQSIKAGTAVCVKPHVLQMKDEFELSDHRHNPQPKLDLAEYQHSQKETFFLLSMFWNFHSFKKNSNCFFSNWFISSSPLDTREIISNLTETKHQLAQRIWQKKYTTFVQIV